MAQLLVMLLAASPIFSCAVRGDTGGSVCRSPRALVSVLLSPIYSLRGWSIKIIRTTVKVNDIHIVCVSAEVMEIGISYLKSDHLYLC